MIHLTGYILRDVIYKSKNTEILRGTRDSDQSPVIVKLLNREYPSGKELSSFLREYDIMNKFAGDGIIKPYAIEKCNNSLAIIMEDIGGESVTRVLQSITVNIASKLSLAIQMTHSLIQLHSHGIIHKDVNPTNFIWNYKTNQVKIIDFGISAELIREASQCINLNILEGTLDYISPEQTGRINRPVDSRSDLYSLGITFYELFTGRLPFHGNDELELIYCQIAKTPVPPSEINPEIPQILSDIIMKMLSKAAEERYQSSFGLLKDLELCQQYYELAKEVSSEFVPGQYDIFDRFEIPHKLYGRQSEIEWLIRGFEKAMDGYPEFLLVSGYSGIGKSTLVHEIRRPITEKNGHFIFGKHNQLNCNIPYYGITQAFRELIKQLFSQSQNSMNDLKQRLSDALGNNGQVIIDIIPELEQIIGPQPQVAELNPTEAQNRFQMTFCEFIKAFAEPEQPLVIFLDDLQWGDPSSLDLIKFMLTSGNVHNILMIGAYRDNEVQEGHPLLLLLEELKNEQQCEFPLYQEISLKPLEFSAVNQLVAETLHLSLDETEPLAKIVYHKTNGNPFFINRLLSSIYHQGTFTFSIEKGQWEYDLDKVEAVEISDNVICLLVKNLELLPAETFYILKLAACIGTQFDLATISLISQKSLVELGKDLWIAITREIILPLNNNYRFMSTLTDDMNPTDLDIRLCFAHTRIQQAVYSLIPENERCETHLLIGQVYLKVFRETKQAEYIFDLVNHLNYGRNLISHNASRLELADLNIIAGEKAMKSTAFTAAINYFETAELCLSGEEWLSLHNKFFSLLQAQATAALSSGNLSKANEICDKLSVIADSNIERGKVSSIKVLIFTFQGKLLETIEELQKTLLLFHIILPEKEEEIALRTRKGIARIQQFLAQESVDELINLPVMDDPEKIMASQLLFQIVPPAIQVNYPLYVLASLTMFEHTLTYGTTPLSCKCVGDCGVVLETVLGDYKNGYKLGEAAFALINKFNAEALKPPVYFIFTYISHWRAHYQQSLNYYDLSYQKGLETGDLMHATYAIAHKFHLSMWVGKNLTECKSETENAMIFLKQAKGAVPLLLTDIVLNAIYKFQAIPNPDAPFDYESMDAEIMAKIEAYHNMVFLGRFYQYNTFVNIIMGNMEQAEKWNTMAETIIFAGLSDFPIPDHYLFQALILVDKWNHTSSEEQARIRERLIDIQQKIKNWADNCPDNFAHKYYLLSAELAILNNESLDIITDFFKKAIDSIGSNDFIQMKALCNELQGKFWMQKGYETIAKAYLREAYYLYKQWGAYRKLVLLEKQYSDYFMTEETFEKETKGIISTSIHNQLDMISILKSAQAISGEIKIEKLLAILINIMIENAGAERGCLLLQNETDRNYYIEAMEDVSSGQLQVMLSLPFSEYNMLCREVIQYVIRTGETVVIHDACDDTSWQNNPYIQKNRIKSVLCLPVFYQNRLKGVVYLENNLTDNVFTIDRLEALRILSSQASISIENAILYKNMEKKITERTIQLNTANEKLKELSLHDPLTGLYNRRYAFTFANDKIKQFVKSKIIALQKGEYRQLSAEYNVIGVFLIDIDHFKSVNDTYGHSAGDNVLVSLSRILKQMIRSDDLLVRWGGEEFLIILYNTKPEYLVTFSKKVLKTIQEEPISIGKKETIHKTCSLGYVEMPLDLNNPNQLNLEQMIDISDYALYCAKENGRNCSAHFKLVKPLKEGDDLNILLSDLSRSSKLNEEYFQIEFIRK